MCGRYTWKATHGREFKELVSEPDDPPPPSYNRAPGQLHPCISRQSGFIQWDKMLWGHPRSDSSPDGFLPINARSETVQEKPIFRKSFLGNRCLIPADGWYEWQVVEGQKYPHNIYAESGESFAFAGIWKSIDRKKVFSILTRSAAPNLLHIHHRAPVALTENCWEAWLDDKKDETSLISLTKSVQPAWVFKQVGSRVNATRNNGPDLLIPDSGKQSLLF